MKTITFKRSIVIKDCKKDFGFGPGVLVMDVIKYKDERKQGFNHPMFHLSVLEENERFLNQHLKVTMVEVKSKRRKK